MGAMREEDSGPYRLAACAGHENLAKAIEGLAEKGYRIHSVIWCGNAQVKNQILNQVDMMPLFTIIGERHVDVYE